VKSISIYTIVVGALWFTASQAAACSCSNQLCSLDVEQSALYLDCILTVQGARLPASFDLNAVSALNQLSSERQAAMLTICNGVTVHKLPALNGLNDLALGVLQEEGLTHFAQAQFPNLKTGKAVLQVLTTFTTMNSALCRETGGERDVRALTLGY
jgi:hypothetical protein